MTIIKNDENVYGDEKKSYEELRIARIRENEKVLSELGIVNHSSFDPQRMEKSKLQVVRRISDQTKPIPERSSKRLRGEKPEIVSQAAIVKEIYDKESGVEVDEDLISKWKLYVDDEQQKRNEDLDACDSYESKRRRLFLVPTGPPGVNDHTLDSPVAEVGSHLWGFCQGLLQRIFRHVRPGDIFLMTSSGGGNFNRVATVKSKKVVSKEVADGFWHRMSFSMGGTSKNDVGFPLLVPLLPPKKIEWDKLEVMRMLGYRDHLQSSRWIKDINLCTDTGSLVYKRCCNELNLGETRTDEEVKDMFANENNC